MMAVRIHEQQDGRNAGRRDGNTIPPTKNTGCAFEIGALIGAFVLLLAGLHILISGVLEVIS